MKFSRKASVASAAIRAVILMLKAIGSQGEKLTVAPRRRSGDVKIAALLNVDPQPIDGDEQDVTPVRNAGGH